MWIRLAFVLATARSQFVEERWNGTSILGPTDSPYRVAVCVVGTARTFVRPHVHGSLRRRVIDVLARGAAVVDVFAVMSLRDAAPKGQAGWDAASVDVTRAQLAAALAAVAPRATGLFEPEPSADLAERAALQARHWRWCGALVARAERADGAAYTHVVKTRPDLLWFADHPELARFAQADASYFQPTFSRTKPWLSDWHFLATGPSAARALLLRAEKDANGAAFGASGCAECSLAELAAALAAELAPRGAVQRNWTFPALPVRMSRAGPSSEFLCDKVAHAVKLAIDRGELAPDVAHDRRRLCELAYPDERPP